MEGAKNSSPCGFCDKVFQRKQDFYEHNNREHFDIICELWECCPRCPKYYPSKMALNKHKVRYHSRKSIQHQEESGTSETCDFCSMFFARKSQYYSHVNDAHQDLICNSWAPCQTCFKYFPTRRIRDRHRNGFKKRGELCAPSSDQVFDLQDDSEMLEPLEESYEMPEQSPGELENDPSFAAPHFMALNPDENDDDDIAELNEEDPEDPSQYLETTATEIQRPIEMNSNDITCPFCTLVLYRKQDYYEHANRDHLPEISQVWKGCRECVRYYPTKKSLNNHEDSHRRKAAAGEDESAKLEPCQYCNQAFARKDQYYKHVNDDHTDMIYNIWFACTDCLRYFPTKRIRDRHRERFKKRGESCLPKYASTSEAMDPSFLSVEYDESNEDLVYNNSSPVQRVQAMPTSDRPFITCTFCKLVLNRKQDYYDHANREHLDQLASVWHGCKDCVRYYPTKKSLNNHEEKSHRRKGQGQDDLAVKGETCIYCPLVFARREQFYRHVNDDHVDIISQSWKQCKDCLKYFPSKRVHDRHREKFRTRGESCIPRYADSVGEPSLRQINGNLSAAHRQTFTNGNTTLDKAYITCGFCSLILQREQDYYDHANREHIDELVNCWEECTMCTRYYPTKKSLYKHKRKSHTDKLDTSQDLSFPVETCEFCSMTFTRKVLYYKHVNDLHKDLVSESWVSCEDCLKYFPTKWVRDRHREGFKSRGESCIPRYASNDGDSEVVNPEDLDLEEEDSSDQYVDCDFCEISFNGDKEYHLHANDEHADLIEETWLACDTCSKFFPSEEARSGHGCKTKLKVPTVTISKIGKPDVVIVKREDPFFRPVNRQVGKLACSFCDQSFGKEQHYYRHVSDSHNEEASRTWVSCEGCNRLFPSKDVCYRHRKKAQLRGMPCNPEGLEFCDICNMSFVRKEAYYKHANELHKDLISLSWVQCEECYRHYPSKAVLNSHRLWYKSVNRSCKKFSIVNDQVEECPYCQVSFPLGTGLLDQHMSEVHALDPDEMEPDYQDEVDYDVDQWQDQSQESEQSSASDQNSSILRRKIKKENFQFQNFPENPEVETLDDCLMEQNFAKMKKDGIKIKKESKRL